MTTATDTEQVAEGFAERVFESIIHTMDIFAAYLGDKLGLYTDLHDNGPSTAAQVSGRTGINERYAQEWLEQQAVTGYLTVDDTAAERSDRRFTLPEGHAAVLANADSLFSVVPVAKLIMAAGIQMPAIADAYRTGGGVSWEMFGDDMRIGQADGNRPAFRAFLGDWIAEIPDIKAKLDGGQSVRIADVGCGVGWSSIALAQAHPNAIVDGFDIDEPSIDVARTLAKQEGVADRVSFHAGDTAGEAADGGYDLVLALECIHDMPYPSDVLATMRRFAGEDGVVVVMDEKVADTFTAPGDEIERLMYGFSITVCLPDSMSHPDSVATGTPMRPSTLRSYAIDAGFSDIEILPIETDLWRFYRLNA